MVEINNRTRSKIDSKLLLKVAEKFLGAKRKADHELSIAIVGDAEMRKLNRQYRKIDRPTDVLSFEGEGKFFGEIVLDPAQVKRQAKAMKKKFRDELIFILVHGLLHLAGMDDKTEREAAAMEKAGEKFIAQFFMKS